MEEFYWGWVVGVLGEIRQIASVFDVLGEQAVSFMSVVLIGE